MIKVLLKKFVRNYEDTADPKVRSRYVLLSGGMGICCNLVLCILKLTVGKLMNSIAVVSDGFNNLSDMGSCIISAVSAKLSCQEPDEKHPLGHGRLEYLASLTVAALILVVAVELAKSSVEKIIHPEPLVFQWGLAALLGVTVLVKIWMFFYNRYLAKQISSPLLRATAEDSISDALATGAVIAATVLSLFIPFSLDGFMGVLVSLFIFKAGFTIAKDTVDLLLGGKPDPKLIKSIEKLVMTGKEIIGCHDLIIHNYGPGRNFASVHAEVASSVNVVEVHETIDALEVQCKTELGVILVIHMDPVEVDNPRVKALHDKVELIVKEVDLDYSIHDFRITEGEKHINIIFDLEVPLSQKEKDYLPKTEKIKKRITESDSRISVVMEIDRKY